MIEERHRVLLIEDDAQDALLVRRALAGHEPPGLVYSLERVPTLQQGLDRLGKGDIDVVALDLHLPDCQGLESVRRLREHEANVPLVVLTVAGEPGMAVSVLSSGAHDYLPKSELTSSLLRRTLRHAVERARLEADRERAFVRTLEARNLESLGVLAAGVAHDFNNLLAVIQANTEAIQEALPEDTGLVSGLEDILEATSRGAALTEQLLEYTGRHELVPETIDLRNLLDEMAALMESIGAHRLPVIWNIDREVRPVVADASALRQLVLNLIENAVEALEGDGYVVVSLDMLKVEDPSQIATIGSELAPGSYVALTVSDDGEGMAPETLARAFDPFFSGSFAGRGLGLAASLGIARRHGGGIAAASQPGAGASFVVFLPTQPPN